MNTLHRQRVHRAESMIELITLFNGFTRPFLPFTCFALQVNARALFIGGKHLHTKTSWS